MLKAVAFHRSEVLVVVDARTTHRAPKRLDFDLCEVGTQESCRLTSDEAFTNGPNQLHPYFHVS